MHTYHKPERERWKINELEFSISTSIIEKEIPEEQRSFEETTVKK